MARISKQLVKRRNGKASLVPQHVIVVRVVSFAFRFATVAESPRIFVLYRKDTVEAIFPRSAFDADGLIAFRDLLEANLSSR
jgi:hypothetical protein